MPYRGSNKAPSFDQKRPRELPRYFEDLDQHFSDCQITDDDEMKTYAKRYVDIESEEVWARLPENATAHSYENFKKAVLKLYPGADDERRWSVTDMDNLVAERARQGIFNQQELGDYHRQFFAISEYLKAKGRISEMEANRNFVKGFRKELWDMIEQRLRQKNIDHFPDDPWSVKEVYEAAHFVLHGAVPASEAKTITVKAEHTHAPPILKAEDFQSFLQQFSQQIVQAIGKNNTGESGPPKTKTCFYCGKPGCMMSRCEEVAKDTAAGKCRRNAEGKVVLPSGAFPPRDLPGATMAERITEWHKRNPNQLAAGTLSSNTTAAGTFLYSLTEPTTSVSPFSESYSYEDRSNMRIEQLEREIFELKRNQVVEGVQVAGMVRRSMVPKPNQQASTSKEPASNTTNAPKADAPARAPEQPKEPVNVPPPPKESRTAETPIHPFSSVPENSYRPPHDRNFAAKPSPREKEQDAAYKSVAPIQSAAIATEVYARSMKTPCITLTQEELMSIAPELRYKVKEAVTPRRLVKGKEPVSVTYTSPEDPVPPSEEAEETLVSPAVATFVTNTDANPDPAYIIPDPIETYMHSVAPGTMPNLPVVAKDSHSLRCLPMKINRTNSVEAVLDSGCQIIAMSEAVCHSIGLIYDPTIYMMMESANGALDRSLGLARNVPCTIGNITLFFQIHVIRSPAYDVLIGRPFDVLTESEVKTFRDDNQTVTIFDPNSDRVIAVPTVPRSRPKYNIPPQMPPPPPPPRPPKRTPRVTVETVDEDQEDF
jgi:Aspartyl protease